MTEIAHFGSSSAIKSLVTWMEGAWALWSLIGGYVLSWNSIRRKRRRKTLKDPIVLAQDSQILNPTGFRNTLSRLPKLTSYLVFPHVVNDHAPLPDAQRPGWYTLTCPSTLLSIASHFHLLNIFWNCPLHLIPCYRLALRLHHLSRRLVEWPPNWSPCPQQQPVKDILHTTVRVIFRKCKSDDHFTPFLWPFSDFPWQKSKLLCSAQKALCGLVPESLQPHFWPFTILLPQTDHPHSFSHTEWCQTVSFLCLSAHVFLLSTFQDPTQLTPLLWHYPNTSPLFPYCVSFIPWMLLNICPF